jgi:hypothetical protein
MFFIIISALLFSREFSAHHQELIKMYVHSLGYCHAFLLSTAGVDGLEQFQPIHTNGGQQENMTIPKAAHTVYKLLMMGGKTTRNMYSADDNNKEHRISCNSLVI